MKKQIVEITPAGCGWLFEKHGKLTTNDKVLINTPENVSLVVFTGGSDVNPKFYGENCGYATSFSNSRDIYEQKMFNIALENGIPMVGICRGSQFLCVMSGGKLVQDVRNHGGNHKIRTNDGRTMVVNSTHHQMQLPPKDAIILAWADPKLSASHYLDGDNKQIDNVEYEYENVYYPNTKVIGIQNHPEWELPEVEFVKYSQEIVDKYLFS